MEVDVVQSSNSAKRPAELKKVMNWLTYIAIRTIVCVLQAMPLELCYSVARALDNPYVERLLRSFRTRTGQEIIYKRGAFDQVAEIMRNGAMIGMLSDQDAGHRGVFVEFFGRPASSHKGVALLALEHD